MKIGIRREDKNEWERRVPLIPEVIAKLKRDHNLEFVVQPSPNRVFSNDEYREAGAVVDEDLSECPLIFAVKEIPESFFEKSKTYMFFSHTIKGQDYNMPTLRKMMELGCTLIDYEAVRDEHNRRLIFFGRQAGQAGMIESLWTLGKRLEWEGVPTPLSEIRRAYEYTSLEEAKSHIASIGNIIREQSVSPILSPLVIGLTGYGNVSQGAQEILDLLPVEEIPPSRICTIHACDHHESNKIIKIVFKEDDTVHPRDPERKFDLQDYYDNPQLYSSRFEHYLPYMTMLVNCIYWEPKYPRLITKDYLKSAFSGFTAPRLKVIGDISIDIEGSIECSVKATDPGNPVYVYNPLTDEAEDGWKGFGAVIMAVDNLPCELPREASEFFSSALEPIALNLSTADLSQNYENISLLPEIKKAIILYKGELTPDYRYLTQYLNL